MKLFTCISLVGLSIIFTSGCNSKSTNEASLPIADYEFSATALDKILTERKEILNSVNLQIDDESFGEITFYHKEENADFFELQSEQGNKITLMLPEGDADNSNCIIYKTSSEVDIFNCNKDNFSTSNEISLLPSTLSKKGSQIMLEYHSAVLEAGKAIGSTRLELNNANNVIITSFAFSDFYRDVLCLNVCEQIPFSVLGASTYLALKEITTSNQLEEATLVFDNPIAGSADDEINLYTGLLIRENNLTTKVSERGSVFSGGTDLFIAGKVRLLELSKEGSDSAQNKQIGVHSWSDGEQSATEHPYNHIMHRMQATYTTKMLGDKGISFYLFTINAAPANGEYFMTKEELDKYTVVTRYVE